MEVCRASRFTIGIHVTRRFVVRADKGAAPGSQIPPEMLLARTRMVLLEHFAAA